MRKKRDLLGRLAAGLDIPREALPGGFGLSLAGDSTLTVRGCKRILDYHDDCIVLAVGSRTLTVQGSALFCSAFAAGSVTVTGQIAALLLGEVTDA
ncbi:MAG: YabP/YqfC family sporulation protein [Clostridia bacterium]|nr:YabP/YqfC family sporulation protein [Clostridia bacterium]